MKTSLEVFSELQPELEELDKEREKTLEKIIILDTVFALLFLFQFLFNIDPGILFAIVFKFELFGVLILLGGNFAIVADYAKKFKAKIIPDILNCFMQDSVYSPTQAFSSVEDFMKSDFIKEIPEAIGGEDLVTGKMENAEFAFSEIKEGGFFMANLSNDIIEKMDIKGKFPFDKFWSFLFHKVLGYINSKIVMLLFLATFLFFVAYWMLNLLVLSVFVLYVLYVLQKTFRYYLSVPKGFKKVEIGNPSLEKKFSIYSTDTNEAKKLFTPELQKALAFLQEKTLTAASVHIRKEKVYIFIPSGVDLFEPRLFRKNNCLEVIQETYDLWQGLHGVIASLNSRDEKYKSV